jgi:hypothetical protein
MAARKAAQKVQLEPSEATGDPIEPRLVAFAEQLGWWLGTVQAKAEGWLDRESLSQQVGRIRDGAADLLDLVNRERKVQRDRAAKPTATSAPRRSRGPVDAPGKRHRKPTPQERIDKRLGEARGKQMGQKSFKKGRRSGRG